MEVSKLNRSAAQPQQWKVKVAVERSQPVVPFQNIDPAAAAGIMIFIQRECRLQWCQFSEAPMCARWEDWNHPDVDYLKDHLLI